MLAAGDTGSPKAIKLPALQNKTARSELHNHELHSETISKTRRELFNFSMPKWKPNRRSIESFEVNDH
ncbi:hypothetical protein MYCTH_2311015 [Thermothelomyces thermophilus ATCC 42464]|uniref:Uncharacterized protein n=1 Tax=Thermothelomyces thermophilus (strain ATCC 42464 / BCRC 31852 / DSM 1799) TaxID=573729 RepID=G2QMF8_THET4|nr:uncharacterized protein MYCTH_2311015 [Thermothelomyces thermophilus ATCC 42464]AEO61138.1 hypothetical protein MYCTH_2311015 [Thermothelomyces thermophilus ATCC 42464]